ncbi:efflux RND transporter permease subunit [Pyruvatibacter sp.]|uniref:efflux RND transporter permease subunit n=1 Tax=Pyruvatibacter sp. TaxID=1981328 RepID=UPI0032F07C45
MSARTDAASQAGSRPVEETPEVRNAHPLARFFFLKTTFATLLVTLLVAGGYMAYLSMVKEAYPDLDIPRATITTSWPGADPQTIEEQVTQEIEDELTSLKGLKSLTSASFDSFSIIAVEFEANADPQESMTLLRSKVSDADSQLPSDVETPTISQVSVDDRPIMTVALYGEASAGTLSELGEELQKRLETINGVSEVTLSGARDEVIQILLDPARLLGLGVSPVQVRDAISRANLEQPFGEIENEDFGAVVRLEGQFRSVADLMELPVTRLGEGVQERPVRLSEIATVKRALEPETSRAFYSKVGSPFGASIDLGIKKSPGTDTVKLLDRIKIELNEIKQSTIWPQEVHYEITQDESEQIWDSLSGVFINALQAMIAVFLILFLILTWREGLIAGISIPVSFAGAMIVIWMLGYSLNEIVIIGMVLALGLVVDVFILMMEGLHEEIYTNNKTFGQAALATVGRYGVPAFAGQLTTVLALAPLMAIGGVSGKFIRVLPVTTIACLSVAFIVALIASVPLSRYLMARVANSSSKNKETTSDRLMASASAWLNAWSLRGPLASKKSAGGYVGGAFALFVLSIMALGQVSVVMYPETDGVNLGINVELPPATSIESSQEVANAVGELLRQKPYFESIVKLVGRNSPLAGGSIEASLQPSEADNFIGFSAIFVDVEDRSKKSFELASELRQEISGYLDANVPGAKLLVVSESSGPGSGDPMSISLSGPDMDQLQALSAQVQALLKATAGTADVRDNLGSVKAEIALTPNREALSFYGISHSDLAAQIRFGLSNDKIGSFATLGPTDDLDILMGMDWQSRGGEGGGPRRLQELSMIRAFTSSGETVSLASLLTPVSSEAPVSVVHKDGQRALSVLSKTDGRPVTEIVAEITPKLEAMQNDWPAGYKFTFGGESEETAETFASAGVMLVVAIIMVFGVLVIVFGSFPQAFILLTTMPLALIGTFLGFFVFDIPFSFFAMVGVISLIGIVANNGIIMIDTMNRRLREGFSVAESAARGAAERMRPILTTSITTVVGLIPLAIGSPMYRPLCLAIIFGLVASTILAMVIVPALYLLLTGKDSAAVVSLD